MAFSADALSEDEGYYFDCDVPPSRYSEWHGPVEQAEVVRVIGTVEVVRLRHDKRWWPVGSIFLKDSAGEGVGLQVYFDWRDTEALLLGLVSNEREKFAEIPLTAEHFAFELTVTRAGLLTATIAGYSASAEMGQFDARRIALSCSSGQFTFRDVNVQYE